MTLDDCVAVGLVQYNYSSCLYPGVRLHCFTSGLHLANQSLRFNVLLPILGLRNILRKQNEKLRTSVNKDTKERNISDIALARRADEIASNLYYDDPQRRDAKFISGIMQTKAYLGFGLSDRKIFKKRKKASWSEELADELHKPIKRKFQRRQVLMNEIDVVWAADLVELQEWKSVIKVFGTFSML